MRKLAVLIVALAWPFAVPAQQSAPPAEAALAIDADWELVYANCAGCHSIRLVTSQRGDRDTWLRLIRWMQETQNLWQFAPEVEDRILDYLARNYAPEGWSRRAPLPEHLLPPRR
jgi:mono/diheme cytochrome c family protein